MAPPNPATIPPPPSMSSKERTSGKKSVRTAGGSGSSSVNNRDVIPSTNDVGATQATKSDLELVQILKTDLGNMRALVTCSICDQLLYEPWTLSCGHTYCYSCLCNWFVPNKAKKTCPECRTSIKRMPAPAFIIKQLVEIFTKQTDLMPSDESVEQHNTKRLEETADVDRDKNGNVGLFKGTFPEGRTDVRFDEEDRVYRCLACGHEHNGEPVCEHCGAEIDDEAYNEFSDMDGDLEDLENLEVDLDADMGPHGLYFGMGIPPYPHFMHGPLHRFYPFHDHVHHHLDPETNSEDSDDHSSIDSESEDEDEEDGSLQDFVVQDGYYGANAENSHDYHADGQAVGSSTRNHAIVVSDDDDDDSDEGGEISNRRRGRLGATRQRRPIRVIDSTSPSAPSVVSVSDSTDESEAGTYNDEAALLRDAGWSPLHHDSDEEHTPTPYEYYGYQESDDDRPEDAESDTETMVGHDIEEDEDDSSHDQSRTPQHIYGANADTYAYYARGNNSYESDEEHGDDDDSDVGLSGMDHDGDTEMSVSPQGFHCASLLVGGEAEHDYPESRSVSVSTDGRPTGEHLGVATEIHEIEENSSDSSIRPPPRRRPRQYQNVRTQEYNPHVSMMFAEHQRSIRRAQDQQASALNDLEQGVWRVEPASVRARRMTSYRVAPPRRHDPLGVSQTPSVTRVISSSERAARAPRQLSVKHKYHEIMENKSFGCALGLDTVDSHTQQLELSIQQLSSLLRQSIRTTPSILLFKPSHRAEAYEYRRRSAKAVPTRRAKQTWMSGLRASIDSIHGGANGDCLPTRTMSYWSTEFSSKDLRSVGNYTLGRLIGKGSFGKVYLASHKLIHGSKVVLKSAKKDDSNLAREIHHHRQFLHPHIARLYEVIVTENLVWLVLEYCPGDELYNYLLKNGALPVEKVQKIFTQLVGAVSYVHNASCVHRDLKLENILLDKNENVKLCDFGFTREYEGKASYLQTFCGTICYSAPEMLKGEKYAGEKVDVWSLGVILYALLCGELPFDDDDDNVTRTKILSAEPKWPDHLTPDARSLLGILLSKRPLLRPALSEILTHPFLAEHAPQQQAILKLEKPAPFTTALQKETLERMRSAGVDIDQVIENVLAQRCDALAGWWSLLIEKEERKHARRERKRKEREAENRTSRRLSSHSSRRGTLKGVDEEGVPRLGEPPRSRGREKRRSAHYPELILTDLPGLPEHTLLSSPEVATPPPPIEKDSIRSASSSRTRRPIPPPKEGGTFRSARSRGSTLHLVTSNPDLLNVNGAARGVPRRKHQHAFINQLASWKHWLLDTTKRTRSPNKRATKSSPDLLQKSLNSLKPGTADPGPRPNTSKAIGSRPQLLNGPQTHPPVARAYNTPGKRRSISPSPLTPRSTYRRQSTGLRGRKSTSSSVSSIRSIHHHHHSHSKASSTSSNGSGSKISLPNRSPHHSVKVLPATPTASAFPSNIRVVRQPPISSFNEGMSWGNSSFGSSSAGGLVFAKRKKNIFKGPLLNTSSPRSGDASSITSGGRGGSHSRSTSIAGRQSEEIIQEEDEDDIEEVEAFSPLIGPGEVETIYPPPEMSLDPNSIAVPTETVEEEIEEGIEEEPETPTPTIAK
ncbi:hypothetical protein BP6252_05157 [Coleophoma cylindrospora]|uniref:Protein kinase domain-containing protein n=1 Tax=Coleophoma cylindrospora TaxID=1849047 RepID=A0A3D8RTB3_9HELO|nr:hypothetical protein BP6252_05157 [Coleophoma cylindrospora]